MKAHHSNTQSLRSLADLLKTPFAGEVNAMCLERELQGDFSEIVGKIDMEGDLTVVELADLIRLDLSSEGQLARQVILNDMAALSDFGASPVLNVIRNYAGDEEGFFFPTDVYSFHVDRSPVPTATFLCTYFGDTSEILPNDEARQKSLIPEIRSALRDLCDGSEEAFEEFLKEHFFDLHYEAKPDAQIIKMAVGELWKLAVDYPDSPVQPCIHRAPREVSGQKRLLLIC